MNDVQLAKELRTAIRQGDVEKAVRLIGADKSRLNMTTIFGSWLHVAAAHGQLEIVKRLLEMGADIDARGGVSGGTPLDRAASYGHYDVVKYLLEHGAVLDVSEPVSNPLFGAIHGGHTAIAKLLIDHGIDTGVKYTGEHMTNMDALTFAREWGRTDIAELLIAAGQK